MGVEKSTSLPHSGLYHGFFNASAHKTIFSHDHVIQKEEEGKFLTTTQLASAYREILESTGKYLFVSNEKERKELTEKYKNENKKTVSTLPVYQSFCIIYLHL